MKTGTIKYTQEFKLIDGSSKWWGIELEYDMATEEPTDVAEKARALVYKFAQPKEGQAAINDTIPPGPPPVITVDRTSEDVIIAETIKGIYACTELNGDGGLSSFRNVAFGRIETKLAYEVMEKKLKKTRNR